MKKSVRAFGIGLFFAGMCFALLNQFDVLPTDDNSAAYKKEIKELKQQLALLQDEAVQEQTEEVAETTKKQATEVTDTEKSAPTTPTSDVQTATIFIYEGMSLYEIGQQIEGEGIVLNGREVELYLARPEYARSIQKGSFDLHSNMTIEEIAKMLTGKK